MSLVRPVPPTAILVAVTMTGPLALNIFLPSMPHMVRVFDTDYATIQLTLTLYLAGVAVGQLIYGPLSDKYGRRPVLLAGLALYVVSSVVALIAPSVEFLILGRVVQAVGGCAGMVLTRAIVRDVHGRDRAASVLAYIVMAMAVAPAVSPAIGGYLDAWFGWHATFIAIAVFGAVVLAGAWRWLHETNFQRIESVNLGGMLQAYGRLLRQPVYMGYALSVAFSTGAFFAFIGGAPYVVIEVIHGTPQDYGIYFILVSIGYMSGSFIAGRLTMRYGVDRMIAIGIAISSAGVLALIAGLIFQPFSLVALFGPMGVIAMGNGTSQPSGVSGAVSVDPTLAGSASGLLGFLQMALGGLLTLILGHVLSDSAGPLVFMMIACTVLGLAAFLMVRRSRLRAARATLSEVRSGD
ncbi:MAG: multidrug effflux MFS transporter [Alphaproteobacteria bacterium]|nr:multidrug effflux MFS transporter [Alphaproteobacteria bacterium]